MFEHVKAVTLRLEQVAVRARPGIRLAAEAPGHVHDVAQQAVINGATSLLHGARIPVVEVDREEELPLFGLGDQLLGLIEVEHQRFLDQQRHTTANQLQGRRKVLLVRQARRHQVRPRAREHLVDLRVGRGAIRRRALLRAPGGASDDRHQFSVRTPSEHPRVLLAPHAGSHDRDAQT